MPTRFEGSEATWTRWVRWSLAAWVVLVLTITLLPRWWRGSAQEAVDVLPPSVNVLDFAANMAMFIPAGVALDLLGWPWRRAVLAAGLFSAAIELAQVVLPLDRDGQLADVIANTAGAAIGCLIVHGVRSRQH
jgi:glycopeptide antibiotics resistance protein